MAGELIMQAVQRHGAQLVPVDSEHAGLFQALQGVPRAQVERLIITGSGGPLWSKTAEQIERATREEVLRHPKWQMGPKITVDSATLMNKGLELIEAHWLFNMPFERLRVVIHPQAVIHALVELIDGTCLAHLSICDMKLPIQYALSFPERWPSGPSGVSAAAGVRPERWPADALPRLRLTDLAGLPREMAASPISRGLQFFEPDLTRFPCLGLALDAAQIGGTACAVLSAANEVAVQAFLREEIALSEIAPLIRETLAAHQMVSHPTLEQILDADAWARQTARQHVEEITNHQASITR
jgi:1-deoxy-D-xylulose-5-phosphate reductoisomerase